MSFERVVPYHKRDWTAKPFQPPWCARSGPDEHLGRRTFEEIADQLLRDALLPNELRIAPNDSTLTTPLIRKLNILQEGYSEWQLKSWKSR